MKKVDRRILKTETAIQTSFQQLLEEKSKLTDISIKDICDKADITRKTFYVHYQDKNDLVMAFMNHYLEELKLTCHQVDAKQVQAKIELWINFFVKRQNFFNQLLKSPSAYQFKQALNDFIKKQLQSQLNTNQEIKVAFICYGIEGIIEKIISAENELNQAQLAQELQEILMPYLKIN